MKNDVNEIDIITFEMRLNDMLYRRMQFELNINNELLTMCGEEDADYQGILLEENYFYRRVLSVFSNEDIPLNSCIGLFLLPDVLAALCDEREEYIGDSDSDTDIFEFVIEYGYRNYDMLCENAKGSVVELFREALDDYYDLFESDGEEDDE